MLLICNICFLVVQLNVTKFNTQNDTTLIDIYNGYKSLNSINVTKFNTQKVTEMSYMFSGCSSLNSIYVSNDNINKFKEYVKNDLLKLK